MSRNDSDLYTGANSASFTSVKTNEVVTKREAQKQKRLDDKHKLKPSYDIVSKILDAEKALITTELANLPMNVSTTEENVKELLMAYQRNLVMINRLRNKFKAALRESPDE